MISVFFIQFSYSLIVRQFMHKNYLIPSISEPAISLKTREGSKSNVTNVAVWSMATICAQTRCTMRTFLFMAIVTLKKVR